MNLANRHERREIRNFVGQQACPFDKAQGYEPAEELARFDLQGPENPPIASRRCCPRLVGRYFTRVPSSC
jgi:hypothetical protein